MGTTISVERELSEKRVEERSKRRRIRIVKEGEQLDKEDIEMKIWPLPYDEPPRCLAEGIRENREVEGSYAHILHDLEENPPQEQMVE